MLRDPTDGGRLADPLATSFSIAFIAASIALAASSVLWRLKSVFRAEAGLCERIETTIISHGALFVTPSLVTISRGFAVNCEDVIDASRIMGATRVQTITKVIFPLVAPGVATGYVLAAIISVKEYLIS